jgi:hypothetical protein
VIINAPDQHPGRCQNWRSRPDRNGYPSSVRCLDYEGTEHVCTFPPPPPPLPDPWGANVANVYRQEPPKPWVKPENAARAVLEGDA